MVHIIFPKNPTSFYLDGIGERVPQVQRAGDIGRRDDHHKGLPLGVRPRLEEALRLPPLVPARGARRRSGLVGVQGVISSIFRETRMREPWVMTTFHDNMPTWRQSVMNQSGLATEDSPGGFHDWRVVALEHLH